MIDILYEDNHILVINKPINIPVQEDESKDKDILTMLKQYLKEKYNKPGNVFVGLIHRLDRPVGGVMVFAKTSKAASRLSEQVRNSQFEKTYLAVVEGYINKKEGTLEDRLQKDIKNNMVKVDKNGKIAILNYKVLQEKDNLSLIEIDLKTGRSHQIRVQFSTRNHPLYGDQRYNPNPKKDQIALFAQKLSFLHPITKEKLEFCLPKPNRYPFNAF